jgi:hypothetical protein
MKTNALLTALAKKVGGQAEAKLTAFLATDAGKKVTEFQDEIDDDFANLVTAELLSKEVAKGHPDVLAAAHGTLKGNLTLKMKNTLKELGWTDEQVQALVDTPNSEITETVVAVLKKHGEFETTKNKASETDKVKNLQKSLDDLKTAHTSELESKSTQIKTLESQLTTKDQEFYLSKKLMGKKLVSALPFEDVDMLARTKMDRKLAEMGAVWKVVNGVPVLTKADGTKLLDSNNVEVKFDDLYDNILKENKYLQLTPPTDPIKGPAGGGNPPNQPPNPNPNPTQAGSLERLQKAQEWAKNQPVN